MSNVRFGVIFQQLLLLTAVCIGSGLAHVGTSTMPFQVGAVIDGTHRSAGEAGLFGFCEVAALAIGMMIISGWVDRVPPRRIATLGVALVASGNVALYFIDTFHLQLAFAALDGLGYGFVFAATVAAAAASHEPDRIYAIGNCGALVLIVGLMSVLPAASGHLGALGVFATLAALALACWPFFMGFKQGQRSEGVRLEAWRIPGAPGLLIAWAAFSAGTGGLYAFSERIAKSIRLAPEQIANVLSIGVFLGLLGTGAVVVLSRKLRRPTALMLGMSGSGLSCLAVGFATHATTFAAGIFSYWIFTMFLYCYLLGTAALLDPTGRVGTLGAGLERLGYALGVAAGGFLSAHTSYSATGLLGFFGCALGFVAGFPSLFQALRRRSTANRAPATSGDTLLAPIESVDG